MSRVVSNPEEYFRQLVPERDALLCELEDEARKEGIPIIGPVVGELLSILVQATQARQILELGTATGYSGIYLARACSGSKGRLVTLEQDQAMAARAQSNFQKAGLESQVEVRVGDAVAEMTLLEGPFDFIFMDIEKKDYLRALSDCQRLLRRGGLLVADNVAFQDADGFNRALLSHPEWRSVHLLSVLPLHAPEYDGLCLALRI